nr:HEAT repeat domain-containing protein [Desulfobulbaceae bacterium]
MARKSGDINVRPWCPFCGQDVARPEEPEQRKLEEFTLGSCQCGAIYVCDQTGHNIGAAMVECLLAAVGDNPELAWDLDPEEDYMTGRVENYDEQTHQVVDKGNIDGRSVRGVLFFVRLNRDIAELTTKITGKGKGSTTSLFIPAMEPLRDPKRQKVRATKIQVKNLADQQDVDGLVDLVFDDPKTLRYMQRLLYDPDTDKRWMYADSLGKVCARFSTRKPGAVSDLLHRLFEACSDSAATHWGLLEAIGSIIAERADIFGAFARHLLMYRSIATTRVQAIWALAEIAQKRPDIVRATPFYSLFDMIGHRDPYTRGHAALLFGRIKAVEVKSKLEGLLEDENQFIYYHDGKPTQLTIAEVAKQAIAQISNED